MWNLRNLIKLFATFLMALPLFACQSDNLAKPNQMVCGADKMKTKKLINMNDYKGKNFGAKYGKLPLRPFEVVLTFDDGPNPEITPEILKILESECVKATFFMVGDRIKENPQIAKQVLQAGHSIGLHSMSHGSMKNLSDTEQIEDYQSVLKAAKTEIGDLPFSLYRFPFLQDTENLTKYINSQGGNVISVDATAFDWEEKANDESILLFTIAGLKANGNSGIILLHDNQKSAAHALPILLKELRSQGYRIVALSQ